MDFVYMCVCVCVSACRIFFRLDHTVRKMNKKMTKFIVLLLVFYSAFSANTLDNDENEIDPFDMISFDMTAMKMRKDQSLPREKSVGACARGDEEKEQVVTSGSEVHINPTATDAPHLSREGSEETVFVSNDLSTTTVQRVSMEAVEPNACPALPLFRQFVAKLLSFVDHRVREMDGTKPVEVCLHVRLTPNQVSQLQSFSRDTSRSGVHGAHDVLTEALLGAYSINADGSYLHTLWLEDKLGLSLEELLQVLALILLGVGLLLMLSKVRFSFSLFFFAIFVISVATTWYRLYQGEVAKQHEAMMKDLPSGCSKLPNDSGMLQWLISMPRTYLSFVQDECIEYYEHVIIDPLVKVSIMEALAVAVVQTALKPLRTVGTEFSQFLRALVKDLPVQWQFVSLLTFLIVFVISLLFCCNYRVHIPFLLAIEPGSRREQVPESKSMVTIQQRLRKLESAMVPEPKSSVTIHQRLIRLELAIASGTVHQRISEQSHQPVINSREMNTKQICRSDLELSPYISLPEDEVTESSEKCDSPVCREHRADEDEDLDISTVGRGLGGGDEQTLPQESFM